MDRWMDGSVDGWIDGWIMDVQMGGWINLVGSWGRFPGEWNTKNEPQGYVWVKKECFGKRMCTSHVIWGKSHDCFL